MQDELDAYRRRIRPIYLAVFVLMTVVCGYAVLLTNAMLSGFGEAAWMGWAVVIVTFPPLLAFAGFLAWRPQWWAKFLLLPAGLSWTMNGLIQTIAPMGETLGGFAGLFWIPVLCGLSAFALAGAHFFLDSRQPPPRRVPARR